MPCLLGSVPRCRIFSTAVGHAPQALGRAGRRAGGGHRGSYLVQPPPPSLSEQWATGHILAAFTLSPGLEFYLNARTRKGDKYIWCCALSRANSGLATYISTPGPESGPDCLMYAEFARQRWGTLLGQWVALGGAHAGATDACVSHLNSPRHMCCKSRFKTAKTRFWSCLSGKSHEKGFK